MAEQQLLPPGSRLIAARIEDAMRVWLAHPANPSPKSLSALRAAIVGCGDMSAAFLTWRDELDVEYRSYRPYGSPRPARSLRPDRHGGGEP